MNSCMDILDEADENARTACANITSLQNAVDKTLDYHSSARIRVEHLDDHITRQLCCHYT
jgi:hypothetical protein